MNPTETQDKNQADSMVQAVLTLRQEFDFGFTQPLRSQGEVTVNFLGIFLGKDAFALRATDIAGLYTDRRVVPMPSPVSTLLGVCRFRSLLTPVFDLAALLGYSPALSPRWTVLVRKGNADETVALAFDHFDSFFSVGASAVIPAPQWPVSTPENAKRHWYDAVETGAADGAGVVRPVIHLPSLFDLLPKSQRSIQQGVNHHD